MGEHSKHGGQLFTFTGSTVYISFAGIRINKVDRVPWSKALSIFSRVIIISDSLNKNE